MINLKIAFRNALRQKRRTILTALTMFGGFTLASISIGWAEGSYSYIINMFTRNRLGHIQIHGQGYLDKPSLYTTIKDYETIGDKIQSVEGVEAWTPRYKAAGLVSVEEKSSACEIYGIDPAREAKTTGFSRKIIRGKPFSQEPSHQAVLGKGLAEVLNADIGQEAVIVSQAADGSIANDIYTITGILESGDKMNDRTSFYLHLKDAQKLFVHEENVHEIAVVVEKLDKVEEVSQKIQNILENSQLNVATWKEFSRDFYQAMQADLQGMWIMLSVIILIVAVGVLNTVLMTVLERTREYGVLKALGTKPKQIFLQVILEINIIALASIVIGAGLSLIINHILSIHGLNLPYSFTYGGMEFKTMYSEISAQSLYIPALTIALAASLVSTIPALRAARIAPARAMRMH